MSSFFTYQIDSIDVMEAETTIRGWATYKDQLTIEVSDENQNLLTSRMVTMSRKDVLSQYSNMDLNPKCGFQVFIEHKNASYLTVVIRADGKEQITKINMIAAKQGKKSASSNYFQKGIRYFKQQGPLKFVRKVTTKLFNDPQKEVKYKKWLKLQQPNEAEKKRQREYEFKGKRPLFSIVVPLYKTPIPYLEELILTVKEQTYENWELCFSDGSGEDSPLTEYLTKISKEDNRIKFVDQKKQLQISENTNAALEIVSGDFIVFADHDDCLTLDALFQCAKAIEENPQIEVLYSDEDKVSMDGKQFFQPHFKPDFNLDLLRSMNYICHLFIVKRELQKKVGLLDSKFDGAQDYDFVLRCVENAKAVYHIPKVLYHWRAHQDSTAENPESKLYAFEAGKEAIQAHLNRTKVNGKVEMGKYPGLYRVKYSLDQENFPLVSVLIPNKDHADDLRKCIESIEQQSSYPNIEYLVIENNSTEDKTFAYYKELEKTNPRVRVVYFEGPFNYSKINNFGASFAKGEYLWLLNNDIQMLGTDFIEEMVGYLQREEVGIVGGRLYYEDDTIQHAGVVVGMGGIAGHTFIGFDKEANGYFSRIISAQDLSAVTAACLMTKKSVFDSVNGFTEELAVAFNDVDFCLKVREQNKLVVYNPFVEAYHFESKSRGQEDSQEKINRFNGEIKLFQERWSDILEKGDPCYSPNLTLAKSDYSLKAPGESVTIVL